jgi:hypothetical protein
MNPPCLYCEEPVLPGEQARVGFQGQAMHQECGFRMAVGSLGHLKGLCGCEAIRLGQPIPETAEHDPPGLTRRQAARAAYDYFVTHHDEIMARMEAQAHGLEVQ